MNRRFRASDNDGRYLTMILCVLDTHTGRLHFTSAGHPPLLLLRGNGPVAVPDAGGLPIAIMDGSEYEEAVIQLEPGDRVFLFSDGLLEQTKPTGSDQFGEGQLLPLLQSPAQTSLEPLVKQVVTALAEWAEVSSFADDVSLVAVEWRG
jgi:sigma-B regulation protein RsbU (phosphoserine phosphatase)